MWTVRTAFRYHWPEIMAFACNPSEYVAPFALSAVTISKVFASIAGRELLAMTSQPYGTATQSATSSRLQHSGRYE